MIPDGSRPLSGQFLIWLLLLPFVVTVLIVIGIRAGIGLWRERSRKAAPDPQNKYFFWLASLGILWLIISIALASPTNYAYSHKKFDAATWKDASWKDGEFLQFSARERMVDDLMSNVLPGLTQTEILDLLGEPERIIETESEEIFMYYLGHGMTDPECLYIGFDERARLEYYDASLCGIF